MIEILVSNIQRPFLAQFFSRFANWSVLQPEQETLVDESGMIEFV
jgi:hypothetical protein